MNTARFRTGHIDGRSSDSPWAHSLPGLHIPEWQAVLLSLMPPSSPAPSLASRAYNEGMETATPEYTPLQARLADFYEIYRLVAINQRYYGVRAHRVGRWNSMLQILAAAGSSMTIVGLLARFPFAVLIITAAASFAGAVALLLGLESRKVQFEKLHFAYSQLLSQADRLRRDLETRRRVDPEALGRICAVQDAWHQLALWDEETPNQVLVDAIAEDVKRAYPVELFWLPAKE